MCGTFPEHYQQTHIVMFGGTKHTNVIDRVGMLCTQRLRLGTGRDIPSSQAHHHQQQQEQQGGGGERYMYSQD